jgi:hypothetical protein
MKKILSKKDREEILKKTKGNHCYLINLLKDN